MIIRFFTIPYLAFLFSLYLAASPSSVFAQDSASKNQDSKICRIQQYFNENRDSSQEKWVWEMIRSGIPANFNTRYGILDPARSGEWNRNEKRRRAISSEFLEIILLDDACQKEISHNGVHIIGAWFEEDEINLENAELKHQLNLEESRFKGRVNFKRLTSPFGISFKKSFFARQFNISWASIKGPLEMDNVTFGLNVRAKARGVWVQETPIEDKEAEWVFMRGLKLDSDITMSYGDFFPVDLQLARIGGRINLEKSHFRPSDCPTGTDRPYCLESFLMAGSQIDGEINMNQTKFLGKVSLQGAEIGNIVSMQKATFGKNLNMRGARLKSDFIMDNGNFQCLNLSLAKIEGQLKMENAEFFGESCISDKKKRVVLDMRDIDIDSQLWMKNVEFHGIVRLSDASVGDQVNMKNTKFSDKLVMYGLRLNSRLTMEKGEFQQVALAGANIRRNLYLVEANFNGELDLKLAKIGSITSDNTRVKSLNLTDTQIDNVDVKIHSKENFPEQLQSQGFTYKQFLIQTQNKSQSNPYEREKLFNEWLDRLEKYTPQPYEMAAKVMRENGYPELATDLLYASKKKGRIQSWETSKLRWAGLWVLQLTIGYGLGARLLLRPLCWLLLFISIGTFVYGRNPIEDLEPNETQQVNHSWGVKMRPWLGRIAFSVDMILPLIRLREKHYDFDLKHDGQRYYFYIHQLFGWLMASFIFAGLAGITQG